MKKIILLLIALLALLFLSHAINSKRFKKPANTHPRILIPIARKIIFPVNVSWYGPRFHGKRTANGGVFNQNKVSAAHVSLPFGTTIKLTNPANEKHIVVTVNDRGPYDPDSIGKGKKLRPHPERQLDISRQAAKVLGFLDEGVVELKAEILWPKWPTASK